MKFDHLHPKVAARRKVEYAIVNRFVKDALAAGYRLAVSLERGYDTETMLLGSRNRKKIVEEAFAGDDCHIFVQPADGPTLDKGRVVSEGWAYFVFGNDGWDVLSDYSCCLEDEMHLLDGTLKLADKYSAMV